MNKGHAERDVKVGFALMEDFKFVAADARL